MKGGQQASGCFVISTDFNTDSALCDGRQHRVGFDNGGDLILQTKPLKTGEGKKRRVDNAFFQLAQSRLNVPAIRHYLEIGAQPLDLGLAPQG